ncbi:MAG TPA: histidine phosphatase family protein [Rickettsiales bacterium]|nr:histidine phosphatase family protein [Rickettsiales bacterium]
MKKLYLFRHGETNWNLESRIQYLADIELNETGLRQAEENAELLKNCGIEYVYSSPLKRAYKTGQILAELINVDIETINELQELDGGDCEGMLKEDVKKFIGEENYEKFSHSRHEHLDFRLPNGETKREVRDRMFNTILDICKNSEYDIIGIASHGFALREFIRATDFEDDSGLHNCECIEAEFDGENIKIIRRIKNS